MFLFVKSSKSLMPTRPTKRVKVYHDSVPTELNLEYDSVGFAQVSTGVRDFPLTRHSEVIHTSYDDDNDWVDDDPTFGLDDPSGASYDKELARTTTELASAETSPPTKKARSPRSVASVGHPLHDGHAHTHLRALQRRSHKLWVSNRRGLYLDELIRWEGRGDFLGDTVCPDCIGRRVPPEQRGPAEFRCRDCAVPDLVCSDCVVKRHRRSPLHRLEVGSQLLSF